MGINFHSQPENCFHLSIYSLVFVAMMISRRIKLKTTSVIFLYFHEHETCRYSQMWILQESNLSYLPGELIYKLVWLCLWKNGERANILTSLGLSLSTLRQIRSLHCSVWYKFLAELTWKSLPSSDTATLALVQCQYPTTATKKRCKSVYSNKSYS